MASLKMTDKISKKIILWALTPLILLPPISMDIYVPSVPSMKMYLNTTAELVQWTLSIFMIGMSLGQIIIGPLIDRFGRRVIGLIALTLYTLSSFACATAHSIFTLIIARLFQALSACGCYVMVWTIIRDIIPISQQGKVFSILNGISGLGPLLAPLLGGYLVLWFYSWRAPFLFLTIYAFLVFLVLLKVLPETLHPDKKLPLAWKQIFKRFKYLLQHPPFLRYAFAGGIGMSCLFAYFSISPILFIEQLGVPAHQYGLYFAANGLVYVLGCLITAQLQKQIALSTLVNTGCFLICLGAAMMFVLAKIQGLTLLGIVIPNFILAFGVGFIFGPAMAGALKPFGAMAGTAAACMGFLQFSLAALVGALVSRATHQSIAPYALTLFFLALLAVVFLHGLNDHDS